MQHDAPTLTRRQRTTVLKAIRSLANRIAEREARKLAPSETAEALHDRLETALGVCDCAAEGLPTYLTTEELDALRSIISDLA